MFCGGGGAGAVFVPGVYRSFDRMQSFGGVP